MKPGNKLLISCIAVLLISCSTNSNNRPKYKVGELVCVGNQLFIVNKNYESTYGDGMYDLKKIDCKSDDCFYMVQESQIHKCL